MDLIIQRMLQHAYHVLSMTAESPEMDVVDECENAACTDHGIRHIYQLREQRKQQIMNPLRVRWHRSQTLRKIWLMIKNWQSILHVVRSQEDYRQMIRKFQESLDAQNVQPTNSVTDFVTKLKSDMKLFMDARRSESEVEVCMMRLMDQLSTELRRMELDEMDWISLFALMAPYWLPILIPLTRFIRQLVLKTGNAHKSRKSQN
jgi:hypothetical protein